MKEKLKNGELKIDGIADILRKIKSDSKIEYDLNGLAKPLIFGRMLNPQAKRKLLKIEINIYFK